MATFVRVRLSALVPAIMDLLEAQGVHVPAYTIRDALTEACRNRYPGIAIEKVLLDRKAADGLVASFVERIVQPPPASATTPAVWNEEVLGEAITALAMAIHCATMNLDGGRIETARVLCAASTALGSLGSCVRASRRGTETCLFLVSGCFRTGFCR